MSQQIDNDFLKKMFPGLYNLNKISIKSSLPTISDNKLSFKDLLEYKVHPCENSECSNYPRTTVANNQYLETELKCTGYHHTKDQRRQSIRTLQTFTGEFEYQANYFRDGKCPLPKERYSNNFFESLYHPLYYKQFVCKREHCEKSAYCPYFHSEKEKVEWEVIFEQNLKLNRKLFLSTKTRLTQSPDTSKYSNVVNSSDEGESAVRSPYQSLDFYNNKPSIASFQNCEPSKKISSFANQRKQFTDENAPPGIYNQFGTQNFSAMLPFLFASRAY